MLTIEKNFEMFGQGEGHYPNESLIETGFGQNFTLVTVVTTSASNEC